MTTVDVVVTARDEERHLPACLRSILGQKGSDFALIVVDDGSVDGTPRILEEAAAGDTRVTVVRHDVARGLAAARNAGLTRATGQWVTFVDGDDLLMPGALRRRLDAVTSAPSDTIGAYGDWVSVPERTRRPPLGRRPTSRPDTWLVLANKRVPFIASAPVLARDLVVALGGFDPRCTTAEDAEFWQWWLRLRARTSYVRHLCVAYRRRAGSMTRRDLAAHFRANRDAFTSFDHELPSDAPSALLTGSDAAYRSAHSHQPRALLAAATAFAEGREDVAREVLGELDPTVLRVAGPGSGARAALATARQRVSGTEGSRPVLAGLRAAEASFVELVEATAAPAPTHAELLEAAAWLGARRDLPEALVGD